MNSIHNTDASFSKITFSHIFISVVQMVSLLASITVSLTVLYSQPITFQPIDTVCSWLPKLATEFNPNISRYPGWFSGIALGYGLDDRGSSLGRGWEFFSSPPRPERLCGSPSLISNGYQRALSVRIKRSGREASHSPPSRAEVKNVWSCTSIPPVRLHGVCTVTTLPLPLCHVYYSINLLV
jgi:hypothetical protein